MLIMQKQPIKFELDLHTDDSVQTWRVFEDGSQEMPPEVRKGAYLIYTYKSIDAGFLHLPIQRLLITQPFNVLEQSVSCITSGRLCLPRLERTVNILPHIYNLGNRNMNVAPQGQLQILPPSSNFEIYSRNQFHSHQDYSNKLFPPIHSSNFESSTTLRDKLLLSIPKLNTERYKETVSKVIEVPRWHNISNMQIDIKDRMRENKSSLEDFLEILEKMDRKFYMATFSKLLSSNFGPRQENTISFVQSGIFLQILLLAISTIVDTETKVEIDECTGLNISDLNGAEIIREVLSNLPNSSQGHVFRWASRLVLGSGQNISKEFENGLASALQLRIDSFNGTDDADMRANILNRMVLQDSKGAIRDTFEPDDLSGGVSAVLLTTLYFRGHWRSAPTVLDGERPFLDAEDAPQRTIRMIRVNDMMGYADMTDIFAQAIEVSYATPGLSLLMLIPRGRSLRTLARYVCDVGIHTITARMTAKRVSATIPLYTLRMTLLLPSKLRAMGISRLVNTSDVPHEFRVSHGVQRIMFWAEAGRNAFKDDGLEWDPTPDLEVVVDRPYIFFVRYHNMTIMNGNFVL